MSKKRIIILLILIIIAIAIADQFIGISYISVKTENLDKSKVKIQKGFYTINRKSDAELFKDKNTLIFNGSNRFLLTEYGENDFLITYEDKYYFQFRNFVYNANDNYLYTLTLLEKEGKIYLKTDIKPGMKFEKQMNLISQSSQLRCNNTIDEDKGVYNGIELK